MQQFPKEKAAFLSLSTKYREASRIQEAIAANEKAIRLDPTWAPAYNEMGYSYAYLKEYDKALEFLDKYIELTPDKPNGYDSKAEVLGYMGRLDDAIVQNRKALGVDSTWLSSLVRLAMLYGMKDDYAEALRLVEQLIAMNQKAASSAHKAYYDLISQSIQGVLSLAVGRYAEARRIFSDLSALAESFGNRQYRALGLMWNAVTSVEKGNYIEGQQYLREWLALQQHTAPANSLRWQFTYNCISGLLDAYGGKRDEIEKKLARASEIFPRIQHPALEAYRYVLQNLEGEVLLLNGRPKEAIEVFRSVVWPNPYLGRSYLHILVMPVRLDGLARAYHEIGNLDAAIEEYRKLITFDPSQNRRTFGGAINHFYLAKLYEEKNWPGLAIQEYTRFLEMYKDADDGLPELVDARKRLAKLDVGVNK